jgi:DNA-directed RNA polymerase subunit RPC12/RpoP
MSIIIESGLVGKHVKCGCTCVFEVEFVDQLLYREVEQHIHRYYLPCPECKNRVLVMTVRMVPLGVQGLRDSTSLHNIVEKREQEKKSSGDATKGASEIYTADRGPGGSCFSN